jgi:hypothetical protein
MSRLVIAPRVLSAGVGMACVALLFAIYMASAAPLLLHWEFGATTPMAVAGWRLWPQSWSALLVALASGLTYAAAIRLGASPIWTASASLSCGFGWTMWMLAVIPSAKSVAVLLVAGGVVATAWWRAKAGWWIVAMLCFLAAASAQSLLPPSGVAMPTSVSDVLQVLLGDFRLLAVVLGAVGMTRLWSSARRAALVVGALLVVCLAVPLTGVATPEAAMAAACVPLWLAVAFGLQWLAGVGQRRSTLALAVVLAVLMPAERWLVSHASVERAGTFLPGSLALGLAAINPGGTLVSDGPGTDRQIGRAAAVLPVGAFQIARADTWKGTPTDVFAFDGARRTLEAAGFTFRTIPRRVPLSVFVRMMPADAIVAVALTPVVAAPLRREPPGYFSGVGGDEISTEGPAQAYALVGRARSTSGAHAQREREAARVTLTNGVPWGEPARPSPLSIDVSADRNAAAIAIEGRELVRVPHGGAIVVTSPDGLLHLLYVITPEQKLLMPVPPDEWSLAQLMRTTTGVPDLPRADPLFTDPLDVSALLRVDGRDASYFTSGWHLPERDGPIDFMWTSAAQSGLLIPLSRALDLRVAVELRPPAADAHDPPLVGLQVNGVTFDRRPALPGRRIYEWRVPEAVWRAGPNLVTLELTKLTRPQGSHDQRLMGAAVSLVRLERVRD